MLKIFLKNLGFSSPALGRLGWQIIANNWQIVGEISHQTSRKLQSRVNAAN